MSRSGAPLRQIGSTSLFIDRLDAAEQPHISLDTGGHRGFYRFDIQFTDRDGKQLGSYSAYVKVMRPFWKPRLALDRFVYRPGQLVLSRPENLGTEWIYYGESFSVQLRLGGKWVPAPEMTPDGSLLWLGMAGPGGVGRCSAASIPDDAAPGRYRIVKDVGRDADWERGGGAYFLTAPFVVR